MNLADLLTALARALNDAADLPPAPAAPTREPLPHDRCSVSWAVSDAARRIPAVGRYL